MSEIYIEEKEYKNIDFTKDELVKGTYENCHFENCNFLNCNCSFFKFVDCVFINCNFSMVKLGDTVIRDVKFINCKMLGLHFENCNEYGLVPEFEKCTLNHSSFYNTQLKKTKFIDSKLIECDFTNCDLSESTISNCDLKDATFDQSILTKVDFRGSYNIVIDPEQNQIRKAKFSINELPGLLRKYELQVK